MPGTVLLVDDDPVILKLLELNFSLEGWQVVVAADGETALALARSAPPDLVVSDVMMPRMSGLELVAALRADPATSAVPLVLLSAKAQADDRLAGMAAGADEYVTKPFEPLDLVDRAGALLTGR